MRSPIKTLPIIFFLLACGQASEPAIIATTTSAPNSALTLEPSAQKLTPAIAPPSLVTPLFEASVPALSGIISCLPTGGFTNNLGQPDAEFSFMTWDNDQLVFLTAERVALISFRRETPTTDIPTSPPVDASATPTKLSPDESTMAASTPKPPTPVALWIQFNGANPDVNPIVQNVLPGVTHCYIGNDQTKWFEFVHSYGELIYPNLYPGVDLVYDFQTGPLKPKYVVRPGATVESISWEYPGAESVELDDNGYQIIHTPGGDFRHPAPLVFEEIYGGLAFRSVKFSTSGNSVTLSFAGAPTSTPLVAPPTAASLPSTVGLIAFHGYEGIYTIRSDGSDLNLVIRSGGYPSWSPDGRQLAIAGGNLYLLYPDGSGLTPLTNFTEGEFGASAFRAAWSPDGTRIAYIEHYNTFLDSALIAVNTDGSNLLRLDIGYKASGEPSWSPDGRYIAFTEGAEHYPSSIGVIRQDFGGWLSLSLDISSEYCSTNDCPDNHSPTWSPNGQQIAFVSERDGDSDIYIVNTDNSDYVCLTDNAVGDGEPVWSPDGLKIAFVSNRDGNAEIYIMNADGSEPTRLTDDPATDVNPAWSPDGKQIAFASDRDGNYEIYMMNADGSQQARLTNNETNDWAPIWSPQHSDN